MYLDKIYSISDLKTLTVSELEVLSSEIREALLNKVSERGGHIGPNLGFVEATIALHYVFNSPVDKIVFDISHQSYTHKMLTGRVEAFLDPLKYNDVSGYSEPSESDHDNFIIGHTSTSVSLASGLAKGRDLLGGTENIIAVIGDGSLSGGEAFEGLDFVGEMGTNMIIVVNDNQMSIAENHGGLYNNLKLLRDTDGNAELNYFKSLSLDYLYVNEGNDIESLITAFEKVKDSKTPIVVHINTTKGKGYIPAEEQKENFHWTMPFDVETGKSKIDFNSESYQNNTADFLSNKISSDSSVVVITAGTPTVMGFTEDLRLKAGKQFVDVGIAEEQAVALASGIATRGAKPVFGVYSTFIQRSYDQLSQDLCINNSPATILVFWGSLTAMNDVTHLCFFDIPLISNIPNMIYLAPTNNEEYLSMLEWSINQTSHPVSIRVPVGPVVHSTTEVETSFDDINKFKITHAGSEVAIVGLGSFFTLAQNVAQELKSKYSIDATIINPRFISGIDVDMLSMLEDNHKIVVTLEDGILDGGFGEKITRFYGTSNMKVINFGAKKEFVDRFNPEEFLKDNHLTQPQIVEDILSLYNM